MCRGIYFLLFVLALPAVAVAQLPEPSWRNEISFSDDPFQSWTSPPYVKFTIITKPGYDPNLVYFQDSREYEYHFDFALENLEPFLGMTIEQFDDVTLHAADQQAILGAVILPGWADPPIREYGIQLVRNDPYAREEVVSLFRQVQSAIVAEPNVTAYYFPTYEQYPLAQQNRDWFADQGLPIGSTAQWAQGNAGYSGGWALGTVKFVPGGEIQAAYNAGELLPEDILLTDGVPAEVPAVAGIMTLMPSTPNSHVAILARSQGVPFVYLALEADAARASDFVGQDIYLAVTKEDYEQFYTVLMLDAADLSVEEKAALLALKKSPPLVIEPMSEGGAFWADTSDLQPADIGRFGGKAANFGVLRDALPDGSPEAMAFSFDLWNAFLDQPISPVEPIVLGPGEHAVFWADDDPEQGPYHVGFKLDRSGEDIGLFASDGLTLIDGVSFGAQSDDVSLGRSVDGGGVWQFLENPSPGTSNSAGSEGNALVINEFLAANEAGIEDPDEPGENPDWIELFNGSAEPVTLSGLFLTDDLAEPTRWQIPVAVTGPTLRDEIALRLSSYPAYPPADMKALSADLLAIRNLFKNPNVTAFGADLESAVIDALVSFGFDSLKNIRFRSSTNVEDSEQFTGAGLYESYSGSLRFEPSILEAIRKVFASFYNDNAFLERLRHDVNEADVGMALLVHHSFPDEIELANGVATLAKGNRPDWTAEVVSQKGAVSVTNPPADAVPEEVRIDAGFMGPRPYLAQRSSLVPLRENTVLEWEREYIELYDMLVTAAKEYCRVRQKDDPVLDFEFKKVAPDGRLVIKQIREIPQPGGVEYAAPFMLGRPLHLCTLQGRGSNVFANHRLKSRWTLTPRSMWLSEENLRECLYADVTLEYVAGGQVQQLAGELALLPEAEHTYTPPQWDFDQYDLLDSWRLAENLCNPRTYRLITEPVFQATVPHPVVTLADMRIGVEVEYAEPVWISDTETRLSEAASLYEPWEPTAGDVPEEFSLDDPNTGVSLTTRCRIRWRFWGFGPPTSAQFESTRIEGLTTEPIVLTGFFSQSIGGGAHLCPKNFLFEPTLEPGISPQILSELRSQNIRLIYFTTGARECRPTEWEDTPPLIRFYGFDDPIDGPACSGG
ncbi:MAG: hypothetical protein JW741_03770 [Sedimentisphaerales bacterium]|nr:hypothetical protein [Sedimentisphaerales bacterium]